MAEIRVQSHLRRVSSVSTRRTGLDFHGSDLSGGGASGARDVTDDALTAMSQNALVLNEGD